MSVSILPTSPKALLSGMAAGPSATQRENSDFARMLSQREAEQVSAKAPQRPPEKPASHAPEAQHPSSQKAEKPHEKTAEERRIANAGGQRPAQNAKRPDDAAEVDSKLAGARAARGGAADEAAAASTEDGKAAAKTADDTKDPAIVDWLAALHLPHQPPADKAAGGAAGDDDAGSAKGRQRPGAGALGRSAGDQDADRLAAEDAAAQKASLQGEGAPGDASAWQGNLAGAMGQEGPGAPAESGRAAALAVDGASAIAGAGGLAGAPAPTGASAPAAASAPHVAHMPTLADSPEFPQALGAQISVLARDGIQQAELHLNPAEMGPISVQIDLQGNQAQVDFGADSAATRQIIENGLPELAAALQQAGFTLSGGGVHQQARGSQGGGDGQPGGQGGGQRGRAVAGVDAGTPAAEPARVRARVSAGGVDLYA